MRGSGGRHRPLRFLIGISVAAALGSGLWAAGIGSATEASSSDGVKQARVQAAARAVGERSIGPAANETGQGKTARPALAKAAAPAERQAKPLATEAFDERFGARISASLIQGGASRLLARPEANDPTTAFTARQADALAEAKLFRPRMGAADPGPSNAVAAADTATQPELAALSAGGSRPSLRPLEARTVAPAAKAPPVAASLAEAAPPSRLPDRAAAPAGRSGKPAKAVLARRETRPVSAALGYARPDDPVDEPAARSALIPWPGTGRRVAVYDISAGLVHMPNGERLEAHSGRGRMRDNPSFSHVKMRGPTPPSTYRLSMREARFHGVEALRLTPVDGVAPHGRVGLLAHTYLLRVPGDSSGCIVFKDYRRFLAAFKRGDVERIVVVPRMGGGQALSAKVASLFSRGR